MNQITLVCTRSAINASALTYMINQSPDYYHNVHNDVWLREVSEQFGIAYTLNDWWNVPLEFTAYDKRVRNADVLTLKQLEHLSDQTQEINLGKNIALFTHATNHKMIETWVKTYNLPITVVTTVMGDLCHHYVGSWLKREYNEIMNDWKSQEEGWNNLARQRLNDSNWISSNTICMNDWLNNTKAMYNQLKITYPSGIDVWVKDYRYRNSIRMDFDADEYWDNIGETNKLTVFMWLLNKIIEEDAKKALAYSENLFKIHLQDKGAHWRDLDLKVRQNLNLTNN